MSNPVRVLVTIVAKADAVANIRAIVLELAAASRKEAGCVFYDVLEDKTQREVFLLQEEWTSDAHLDAHNTTPHFHKAVTSAQPYLAEPLEVRRLSIVH